MNILFFTLPWIFFSYHHISIKLAFHPLTGFLVLAGIFIGISFGDKYYSENRISRYSLIFSIVLFQLLTIYYTNIFLGKTDFSFIKWQFAVILLLILFITDLFKFKPNLFLDDVKDIFKVTILYGAFLCTIFKFNEEFGNYYDAFYLTFSFFIITSLLIKVIRIFFKNILGKNLAIIADSKSSFKIQEILKNNPSTMYNFLGFIEKNEIENFILKNLVDEIIIALPEANDDEIIAIIKKLDGKVKKVRYMPKVNGIFTFNSKIQDFDGILLITATDNLIDNYQMLIKRVFDILGSLIGIILLLPIYLYVKKNIRKEDNGPIFFSHPRVGINLVPFKMLKFRTMYIDAEKRLDDMLKDEKIAKEFYTNFKLKNDPRITKFGNFLRNTSLDEFPQFINVLKGDMSLVGPRPVVEKEVEMYYGSDLGKKVFLMKPGITGMWQSHGRSDIENYDERIRLDLYYLRNWSIFLDFKILLLTIKNVLSKKGAY